MLAVSVVDPEGIDPSTSQVEQVGQGQGAMVVMLGLLTELKIGERQVGCAMAVTLGTTTGAVMHLLLVFGCIPELSGLTSKVQVKRFR